MKLNNDFLANDKNIIGCDEVGRGPLAGPVVGCAVKIIDSGAGDLGQLHLLDIKDSKKLTSTKRKKILSALGINIDKTKQGQIYSLSHESMDITFCLVEKSHNVIDEINILAASLLSMKEASEKLIDNKSIILIDGNKKFESNIETHSIVKGDSKIIAISLASIIAKEYRDLLMCNFDIKYPGYSFSRHSGYPTKAHKEALKNIGPCPIHRKSFKGVKRVI